MLKCRICKVLISQDDADRASCIVGPGHETMCEACAESLATRDCSDCGETFAVTDATKDYPQGTWAACPACRGKADDRIIAQNKKNLKRAGVELVWEISYLGTDEQWHACGFVSAPTESDAARIYNANRDAEGGEPKIVRDNPGWCSQSDKTSYRVRHVERPTYLDGSPLRDVDVWQDHVVT